MFGRIVVIFLQFFLLCLLSYIGQISNFLSGWEQIFWFSDTTWNGLYFCFGRKSVLSTGVVLRLISLMPLTPVNQEQFCYIREVTVIWSYCKWNWNQALSLPNQVCGGSSICFTFKIIIIRQLQLILKRICVFAATRILKPWSGYSEVL